MEWVKIKSGAAYARMLNSEFGRYVELARGETSPGDGWHPVEKVLPKPVPAAGEELGYSYTVRDGVAYKEYFVVRPVVYDKYRLVMALERAGLLGDFVALVKSDPTLEMKWNAASRLDYDDDTLETALAAVKQSLGVTDGQIAAVLAEAEVAR